nr:Zn-ribbon domain-containing OB-fold protein [Candidatus Njordarchaeota archaeon]
MGEQPDVLSYDPLRIVRIHDQTFHHSYGKIDKFFKGFAEGKLLATKCEKCKKVYVPPRADCPFCLADLTENWVELPKECELHTFSVLYFAGPTFFRDLPFILGLAKWPGVETYLMGRIKDVKPDDVKIGMKLRTRFAEPHRRSWTVLDFWFEPSEKETKK